MAASFKVECFREQRLGIVLDPCKGSSYYYVKNLFSKSQSAGNRNVRTTADALERRRHSTPFSVDHFWCRQLRAASLGVRVPGSASYL